MSDENRAPASAKVDIEPIRLAMLSWVADGRMNQERGKACLARFEEVVREDERRSASGRLVAAAKALRDFPSPGDPVEFARLHAKLYEAIDE